MAEQLKEFKNVLLTKADFDANSEYAIIANNTTTQAVVKDMDISVVFPTVAANVGLHNGISTVASTGVYSGFELIEKSGSLKIKLDPPLPTTASDYDYTSYYDVGSTAEAGLSNTSGNVAYYLPAPAGGVSAITTISTPAWFAINTAGDTAYYFTYNGNNGTGLYSAPVSGGNVGSWTNISSIYYQYKTVDLEEQKIYWQAGIDSINVLNMTTGAIVGMTAFTGIVGAITPSTYAHSYAVNGIFFSQPSNAYTNRVQYYDTATGNTGLINGSFLSGVNGYLSVCFNPTENRYYILTKSNANTKLSYINGNVLSGDYTATSAGNGLFSVGSGSKFASGTVTGHFLLQNSEGRVEFVKPNVTGVSVTRRSSSVSYSHAGPVYTGVSPFTAADVSVGINLKVSGVEITGV